MKRLYTFCLAALLGLGLCMAAQPYSDALYKKASKGDKTAQYEIGLAYIKGNGIGKDLTKGIEWMKKSAEGGNVDAMVYVGDYSYYVENNQDSFRYYKMAADRGNSDAMYALSVLYKNGEGVVKDLNKSASYLKQSAEKGNVSAMYTLGNYYERGDSGLPKNKEQTVYWWTKAAEKNNGGAQYNLGYLYFIGDGVAKNPQKGLELWEKAAWNEYPFALLELGMAYHDGSSYTNNRKDYVKAYNYLTKFQNLSNESSGVDNEMMGLMYWYLSNCYRYGRGCTMDANKAEEYLKKAAAYDNPKAKSELNKKK